MQATLTFVIERETKNKIRYQEEVAEGETPIVEIAYLPKWFLGNSPPQRFTMVLSDGAE